MKATTWFYGTSFHPATLDTAAPALDESAARTADAQRRMDAWTAAVADGPELKGNLLGPRTLSWSAYDEHCEQHRDGGHPDPTCDYCAEDA